MSIRIMHALNQKTGALGAGTDDSGKNVDAIDAFCLTGNIGCGKSTIASLLAEYTDVAIFDCDQIAKEIISDPVRRLEISEILGVNTLVNRSVDFKLIAQVIFSEPDKKVLLEKLTHPLVWKAVQEKVDFARADMSARKNGRDKICIVESAIVYETRSEDKFAAIIVASCDRAEQLRRLRQYRTMSDKQIQARLDLQISSEEKVRRADLVIETNCTIEELKKQVFILHQKLKSINLKGNST